MHTRSILFVPLATLAIYACSGSEPPSVLVGYEDVLLEGAVTDESLAALVEALGKGPPADAPTQAAVLVWPANGEKLPRDPVGAFCWRFGDTMAQKLLDPPRDDRWASVKTFTVRSPADLALPLRELFGPPRAASAHGDPYTGVGTYLVFSTDTDPKLVRVFTSDIAYHPSQAVWDKMAKTNKLITLKLVSAFFNADQIGPNDGPVAGSTIQIMISQ